MYPTRWKVLETREAWVLLRSGPMLFTVPRSVLPVGVRPGETLVTSGQPVGCYPVWHRAADVDDPAADARDVTMPPRRRLWNEDEEDEGDDAPPGSRWRRNRGSGRRP